MLRKSILCIIILLLTGIFSYSCLSFGNNNEYFSKREKDLLEKTLNTLEYGYGYDFQMEMEYIYSYKYSKDNLDKKEKAVADIIDNADFSVVLSLYDKIVRMQALTDYKLNKYRQDYKWKYHTFIKNELFEPLNYYSSLLKKNILKKNSSIEPVLAAKKESVYKQVEKKHTMEDTITDTF